jgi:hypothetical protein
MEKEESPANMTIAFLGEAAEFLRDIRDDVSQEASEACGYDVKVSLQQIATQIVLAEKKRRAKKKGK